MENFGIFKLLSSLQKDGGDKESLLAALLKGLSQNAQKTDFNEKTEVKSDKTKEKPQEIKLSSKENNPLISAMISHDDFINKVYKKNGKK